MSAVIWFRVNKISIETWEACLQRQESSSLGRVWPARLHRPPLSPHHCHWDNHHHRHSQDQLKVIKGVLRSASAVRGRTKVCSSTRPHFPWPQARPTAPGLCLKGEPWSRPSLISQSQSGIILINIYAWHWVWHSVVPTASLARSDQCRTPAEWLVNLAFLCAHLNSHYISLPMQCERMRVHILLLLFC